MSWPDTAADPVPATRPSITAVVLVRAGGLAIWGALLAWTWSSRGVAVGFPLGYWLLLGVAVAAAGTRLRWVGLAALVAALGAYWHVWGFPLSDREALILWLVGALAVVTLGRPDRSLWRLLVDWLPFAGLLILYDYSRGAAHFLHMPIQVDAPLNVDKFLAFGHVPTIWLQQHLLGVQHPVDLAGTLFVPQRRVAWWELLVSLCYLSHFIASYALAAWLWFRDHDAWWRYTKRFITLSYLGVATYALVPAAPPWMAAWKYHRFGDWLIPRTVNRGYDWWHLHFARHLVDKGQAAVNLQAALPSLHEAFATLVAVTLWPRVRNPFVRVLLVLYPLWMGFSLVLSGEHYVADLLLGLLYVVVVVLAWDRIDAWWDRRKAAVDAPLT